MAETFNVSILIKIAENIKGPAEKASKSLKRFQIAAIAAKYAADETSKTLAKMASGLEKAGKSMSLYVTAPIVGAGIAAVKSAGDFELMQAAFKTMLGGDAKKAAQLMQDLTKFGAETPFELKGLGKATQTLLSFGIAQEDTIETMRMLGDIAQGDQTKLQDLALIYGQAKTSNQAFTQDIRQLTSRGAIDLDNLAKVLGTTRDKVFDMASKGKITFDVLNKAMRMSVKEGGKFFNGMKEASQTLPGIWSNFTDAVDISLMTLGKEIVSATNLKEILKGLGDTIANITSWFANLTDNQKRFILTIVGIVAAVGPLLFMIGKAIKIIRIMRITLLTLNAVGGPVFWIIAAIAALAFLIYSNWDGIKEFFVDIWNDVVVRFKWAWSNLKRMWSDLVNFFKDLYKKWENDVQVGLLGFKIYWLEFKNWLQELMDSLTFGLFKDNNKISLDAQKKQLIAETLKGALKNENKTEVAIRVSSDKGTNTMLESIRKRKGDAAVKVSNNTLAGAVQ